MDINFSIFSGIIFHRILLLTFTCLLSGESRHQKLDFGLREISPLQPEIPHLGHFWYFSNRFFGSFAYFPQKRGKCGIIQVISPVYSELMKLSVMRFYSLSVEKKRS